MSAFLTKLEAEQVEDTSSEGRGTWQLLFPLEYKSDYANCVLTVPAGFVTDFTSIPRIPLVFDWLGDRGNLAGALHDWLYTAPHPLGSRADADRVLREALIAQGVSRLRAWFIYFGVRVGGGKYYD